MLARWLVAWAMIAVVVPLGRAQEANYGDDLDFLGRHGNVVEISNGNGVHVAICPQRQGRVMTSTCEGREGKSFGWINRSFIESGQSSKVFNNYGGEDRFWISPEAAQFALFFPPGKEQKLANWYTQPGLNEGAFQVVSHERASIKLKRRLELTNYANTKFTLDVDRNINLLPEAEYAAIFGADAARLLASDKLKHVGFATENTVTNRGAAITPAKGLISIWSVGQFKPGPHTVIMIPFKSGNEAELGPPVTPDYFGPVPAQRLQVTKSEVLFLGDGHFRAKLGISPRRSRGVAGSYNFDQNILTLVSFNLAKDLPHAMYIDNRWQLPLADPYHGDAFNSYNDGPAEPGAETLGGFYELETLSPTAELPPGSSLRHTHRTIHVVGDPQALAAIAKAILGVDLDEVKAAMVH